MSENAPSLAVASLGFATNQLLNIVDRWMPGLRLPYSFGGHPVRSDVAADLAFTLTQLARCKTDELGEFDVRLGIVEALDRIVGNDVSTFWSYRVAESLLLFGDGPSNEILGSGAPSRRRELERACDASAQLGRLGTTAPTNFAFVLARCEFARGRLGLVDTIGFASAVQHARAAMRRSQHGFIDDSARGHGRFDLYMMDSLLFAEPLSDHLAPDWDDCFRRGASLCRSIASPSGELIGWGRSNGVLAIVATVQVAATAIARRVGDRDDWEQLGRCALESLSRWFDEGVVNMHRRAGHDRYRNEARWLQLTLDIIGKVASAAQIVHHAPPADVAVATTELFADHNDLHRLSERCAVWSYRKGPFGFSMPFVAGPDAGYLAVPHQPGTFEVVADSTVALMTPVVHDGGRQFVSRGAPTSIEMAGDGVEVTWTGFKELDGDGRTASTIGGARTARFQVVGRCLIIDDTLTLESPPDAVVVAVADTSLRTCSVSTNTSSPVLSGHLDIGNGAGYRSHFGQLRALHSAELHDCTHQTSIRWQLSSSLRICVTSATHWYTDTIYRHLVGSVDIAAERFEWPDIAQMDLFHMHWPERIGGRHLGIHRQLLRNLRLARVPIVWTVHNLAPHEEREGDAELYSLWAAEATAAIHHSEWGMSRAMDRYPFSAGCVHRVIRHPHFGHLLDTTAQSRDDAGKRLGFGECTLRIGVIGAPRRQRDLDRIVDGILSSDRSDVQLVVFSVADPRSLSSDARIVALPQEFVTRPAFNRRIASLDAIAIPYFDGQMLCTGVIAEAIGANLPVLTPDWGFAAEVLGAAAIPIGSTARQIGDSIAAIDAAALGDARARMVPLRERDDPAVIAAQHLKLFDEVTSGDLD